MSNEGFHSDEYGDGSGRAAASLVVGYKLPTEKFARAGRTLAAAGYDAIVYGFDPEVLEAGDPRLLIALVGSIKADFLKKASTHKSVKHTGVSMGAGVAWNLNKDPTMKRERGVFAAAGASMAHAIFHHEMFKDARKGYERNHHDEASLEYAWRDLQEPPEAGFTLVLGKADEIVDFYEMQAKIKKWNENDGVDEKHRMGVRSYLPETKSDLDHMRTILWFNRNIGEFLNGGRQDYPLTNSQASEAAAMLAPA